MVVSDAILTQILAQLNALQVSQQTLQAKVRFTLLCMVYGLLIHLAVG